MSQGMYTITSAREGRTYTGKHGDLVVWLVKLKDAVPETPTQEFELHKKPGNTPEPGDQIEVDRFAPGVHDGQPYVRIFAASMQSSGGSSQGGGGGGGDSKNFDRRPEHPRNEARMIHTSSLSAAPGFIDQMLTMNITAQPKDEAAYWALVGHVAGRLTRSYEQALKGTETPPAAPQQETLNGGGGEVPADTTDLQPAAAPGTTDGDDIPF